MSIYNNKRVGVKFRWDNQLIIRALTDENLHVSILLYFKCILRGRKKWGGEYTFSRHIMSTPAPSGCFWHLPLLRISQYCKIRKFKVKISGVWDQDKWCLRSKLQTPWSWFQTPWSRKWVSTDWRIWSFSSSGVWRGEWCNKLKLLTDLWEGVNKLRANIFIPGRLLTALSCIHHKY